MATKPNTTELIFFWVLFGIAGVLAYFIFAPYLTTLFLGLVLAIVLYTPYQWMLRKMKGRETLAASLMTTLTLFLILIPLFFIGTLLAGEVVDAYNLFSQSGNGVLERATSAANSAIQSLVPGSTFQINLSAFAGHVLQYISSNLNALFMGVAGAIFDVVLMLAALFFFLRDGQKLKKFAEDWSPLPLAYDENILSRLSQSVSAVVKGTLVVAVVQGVATGIGLAIFGVPGALLWGLVAVVVAMIPAVGTALVFVPAALYLIFSGAFFPAIGLVLWGALLVGNLDGILRPILMRKGLNLHPLITFLSVLGGLAFFGPIGFVAGPIAISLFFVLLDVYPKLIRGEPAH